MWRGHQSGRSSAAGYSASSAPAPRSCLLRLLTMRMAGTKRGLLKRPSLKKQACLRSVSARRSEHSSTSGSSRSSTPVGRDDQHAIGSPSGTTYAQRCNAYLGRVMGNQSARMRVIRNRNDVTSKVVTTHVGRSTGLRMRALARPGSAGRRSSSRTNLLAFHLMVIGRLAGRCPCGEQAQGDVAHEVRQSAHQVRHG